jgi:hypothetical protein
MKFVKTIQHDVPDFQDIRVLVLKGGAVIARVSFSLDGKMFQHDVDITGSPYVTPLRNMAVQAIRDGAAAAGYSEVP